MNEVWLTLSIAGSRRPLLLKAVCSFIAGRSPNHLCQVDLADRLPCMGRQSLHLGKWWRLGIREKRFYMNPESLLMIAGLLLVEGEISFVRICVVYSVPAFVECLP